MRWHHYLSLLSASGSCTVAVLLRDVSPTLRMFCCGFALSTVFAVGMHVGLSSGLPNRKKKVN